MRYYLGKAKDKRCLLDTDFILGRINEKDKSREAKAYEEMVIERKDMGVNKKLKKYLDEFINEQYEYKSYRQILARDINPEELIRKIAKS